MGNISLLRPIPSSPEQVKGDSLPHVLLVVDQFPRALGGGERIVLKLAALLPQYGYRVSILTFAVHPESNAVRSATCPVYLLPLQRTYDFTALRAAFELRRFLKNQQILIVQTFFESSDLWAGFVTKTMSSAKLIWSRRDMGILRTGKHHRAYRLMARMPDKVFAVSDLVRKHGIEVDNIPPDRILTIHNGLNLAEWVAPPKSVTPQDPFHVTTAGNIRHVKGHDIFIRAAASIAPQFPKATFSIAGEILEPAYFEELQTLVRALGLTDRFHFAGGISNLRDHLASAGIFVLPSRSEGFSNAIVEAMAVGLPVVATNVGGNAEAVQDGVSGFIVPPEDPAALAAAILQFFPDPSLAKKMGDAGRELVAAKFTTEAMMRSITDVYKGLLAAS
jgi:glycosyltransferase involved in cell wall biosynthesis